MCANPQGVPLCIIEVLKLIADKRLLGLCQKRQEIIQDIGASVNNIADFGKKIQEYANQNTTNLLDVVLYGAIKLNASDIHIEPQTEQTRLRIRLDGILQDAAFFRPEMYHKLLSRLKLLSKLKLNVTTMPQDGRFSIAIDKAFDSSRQGFRSEPQDLLSEKREEREGV